eukprot:TRINITY_DN3323_c0_g5_i1.p1 TRINITY_DN3323_c0_g5~~TRINITY_DN3323_c0_g5_i1.p1  ORF type:complete len:974 (+),score=209.97 TRINITY_DN3323_c0_g5_i1:63-2984(+)
MNGLAKRAGNAAAAAARFAGHASVVSDYKKQETHGPDQAVAWMKDTVSDELRARELQSYLRHDIEKARAYREMPLYGVFLALLTVIPYLSSVTSTRYNELFYLEKANRVELHWDQFERVSSRETFWLWFRDMMERSWELRTEISSSSRLTQHNNFPIGYILLRQYRVRTGSCSVPAVLTNGTKDLIPRRCAPEWSESEVSTDAFGPLGEWVTSSQLARPISVASVTTATHTYDRSGDAFPHMFSLQDGWDTIGQRIRYLENNSWIDMATRVVIVDVLTYNPSLEAFTLNHMYAEFFATGSADTGLNSYPFILVNFNHSGQFAFACDIGVTAGLVVLVVGLARSLKNRRALGYNVPYVGLWDLFDIFFLVFLSKTVYHRFVVWSEGPALHSDHDPNRDDFSMFVDLFEYGFHFEAANTFLGITIIFSWLRLFRYLQYNSRLGVVSGTIRRSSEDLMAMAVMFLVVLLAFGIGGAVLYGVDHKAFSSWIVSMGYLSRLLISAEVDAYYDELKTVHPNLTGPYFLCFMILTWCVLMNMVLAILNGAFMAVQDANRLRRDTYSIYTFKKDVLNLLSLWFPFLRKKRHEKYCDKRLEAIASVKDAARTKAAERLARELPGRTVKKKVRTQFERDALFTYEDWQAVTSAERQFGADKAHKMFERAAVLAAADGSATQQIRLGNRFAMQMQEAMSRLEEACGCAPDKATVCTPSPLSPPLTAARSEFFGPVLDSESDIPPPPSSPPSAVVPTADVPAADVPAAGAPAAVVPAADAPAPFAPAPAAAAATDPTPRRLPDFVQPAAKGGAVSPARVYVPATPCAASPASSSPPAPHPREQDSIQRRPVVPPLRPASARRAPARNPVPPRRKATLKLRTVSAAHPYADRERESPAVAPTAPAAPPTWWSRGYVPPVDAVRDGGMSEPEVRQQNGPKSRPMFTPQAQRGNRVDVSSGPVDPGGEMLLFDLWQSQGSKKTLGRGV